MAVRERHDAQIFQDLSNLTKVRQQHEILASIPIGVPETVPKKVWRRKSAKDPSPVRLTAQSSPSWIKWLERRLKIQPKRPKKSDRASNGKSKKKGPKAPDVCKRTARQSR